MDFAKFKVPLRSNSIFESMKFGSVENPQDIDFTLPPDHKDTAGALSTFKRKDPLDIYVGCANWSKPYLKGFYPRGTKDALVYYAKQFNSIELNATFYRIFSPDIFASWYEKTPVGFKFFPKLFQEISHWKRLGGVEKVVDDYLYSVSNLKEKLGTIFLQMHTNFTPKDFNKVEAFVKAWPSGIRLAIEFRHTDWYHDTATAERLYDLFETYTIANVIVDTAGRRDLIHMRLTNGIAFIRYVGANHESDFGRLDQWVARLKEWHKQGVQEIDFFIHQNIEKQSPLLSAYFIKKLNADMEINLKVPNETENHELLQNQFN